MVYIVEKSIGNRDRLLYLSVAVMCILAWFYFPKVLAETATDTIYLKNTDFLVTPDSTFDGKYTAMVLMEDTIPYKLRTNRDAKNTALYDSISAKTKKIPLLHNLFNAMRVRQKMMVEDSTTSFTPSEAYFTAYEGKVIRSIRHQSVDIFEGDVDDITQSAESWGAKTLNRTHYNTRRWVKQNFMLFEEGDRVDAQEFSDTERILRSLNYIEDARIYMSALSAESDSVDILVVTKDNFPIAADVEVFSPNHFIIDPYTTNFIGLGHRLSGRVIYRATADQQVGYGVKYEMNNLFGAFVNLQFGLSQTDQQDLYEVRLTKRFVSTETRFGGEFESYQISEDKKLDRQEGDSLINRIIPYSALINDSWAGYSFLYLKDRHNQFLNFALRSYYVNFSDRPDVAPESQFEFHNQYMVFGNLSYRKIDYMKTTRLLGFGKTEDVPFGYLTDLTYGRQWTEFYTRDYFGAAWSWAQNYDFWGYYNFTLAGGGYLNQTNFEDIITTANFSYFSPLSSLLGVDFRNTFDANYMSVTRPNYYSKLKFDDNLWLLKQYGLFADSRLSFRLQTTLYTNINLIGFRFAFYPYINLGWMTDEDYFRGSKRFFSVYGLGMQVKNESLVIPGFHIRVGYLPHTIEGQSNWGVSFFFKDLSLISRMRSMKPRVVDPYYYRKD